MAPAGNGLYASGAALAGTATAYAMGGTLAGVSAGMAGVAEALAAGSYLAGASAGLSATGTFTNYPTRNKPASAGMEAAATVYSRGHLLAAGAVFYSGQATLRASGGSFLYNLVNDPRITRIYTAEIEYWGRT